MHVGDLDWRAFGPHGFPLEEIIHLWVDDGELVGWVLLSSDGFDYQVRAEQPPGVEEPLVAWGQSQVLQWRAGNGLEPRCAVETFTDDARRVALLERLGYRPTGAGGVQFERALSGEIHAPSLPEGWEVRGLRDGDIDSRATAQSEAFAPGSKTTPATWRHLMASAPGYDADLDCVVVSPDGVVASAAMAWLDIENAVGEFEPVATRPSYQRQGLGKAVLLRGLRKMRERAMRTAIVQTNASNDAAIALYQSVGFRIVGRSAEYALDVAALSA
jgi:ribosomal protein S18 acetylase RimI-like enzyme